MKLQKEIGLAGVFSIATGAMISSGLFVLPAIAYMKAGPAVFVSYFIAGILILPALFSIIELLTAMPKSGGDYFFISRSLGSLAGFLGGLLSWFSLIVKIAFALVGIGGFVSVFYPAVKSSQMDFIAVFFCIFFMFINLKGVGLTKKFQNFFVAGLIIILVFYIASGGFRLKIDNYRGFWKSGSEGILGGAGLVFVSFMGILKIAGVAEEVKNPVKNIPLGLILSWSVVMVLYVLAVFVTVGIKGENLIIDGRPSLMPLSYAAESYLGFWGSAVLAFAALLAFVSTANAGILSSSRTPSAMAEDKVLPGFLKKLNRKDVPGNTIVLTSAVIIFLILAFNVEEIAEIASTATLLLFSLTSAALIFMRESKIRNYKPVFRAPLYPYLYIAGIIFYFVLLFEMGRFALISTAVFLSLGAVFYALYPLKFESKKSALVHVVERVIGRQISTDTLSRELKGVLLERDSITEDRFDKLVKESLIMDIEEHLPAAFFFKKISARFAAVLGRDSGELYGQFIEREKISPTVIKRGLAIPHIIIEGEKIFSMILVRAGKGVIFPGEDAPVKTLFAIVASADERNFYLRALIAIAEIVQEKDFEEKWLGARSASDLEDIILLASRKREEVLT